MSGDGILMTVIAGVLVLLFPYLTYTLAEPVNGRH
jgi:hypothetical protein